MAASPILYVYYPPENDDSYPGVPNRNITEADWSTFTFSQRRTIEDAFTGYSRRKVWLHRDQVTETEAERAAREEAERQAREAYNRQNSLVRYGQVETIIDQMAVMPSAAEITALQADVDAVADVPAQVDTLATQVASKADGTAFAATQADTNKINARVIDLADYCDLTGSTVSTSGLQAAVNAAATAHAAGQSPTIYLRNRGYIRIDGTVDVPNALAASFRFVGDHQRNSRIIATTSAPVFRMDPNVTRSIATRRQYAAIERLSINGPGKTVSGSVGILLNNAAQGVIRDVHIHGFETGVKADGYDYVDQLVSYYNRLDNVYIFGCVTGLRLARQANSNVMTGGGLKDNEVGVLIDSWTDNFNAHGVDIEGNTSKGAWIKGFANQFMGCRFENPLGTDIHFDPVAGGTYDGTDNIIMSWLHPVTGTITWDPAYNNMVKTTTYFHMGGANWDTGGFRMGNRWFWVHDAKLYMKSTTAPTAATDGQVVGTQV